MDQLMATKRELAFECDINNRLVMAMFDVGASVASGDTSIVVANAVAAKKLLEEIRIRRMLFQEQESEARRGEKAEWRV